MNRNCKIVILLCAVLFSARAALSQYSGGSGDGYTSSRSDDILYDGTTPVVTGAELPDVVHNLTIDNPGGVTLSKDIIVNGDFKILQGNFDLNGHAVTFGDNATLIETGGSLVGANGEISATRTLNEVSTGQNVAGLGLVLKTEMPLGQTSVGRGHTPQQLTPADVGGNRFYDVDPTNNINLNATVEFHYNASELGGIPEADLALFKTEDFKTAPSAGLAKAGNQILGAPPTWQYLGGTVSTTTSSVGKGGIGDFSRLTFGRAFVLLAQRYIKIDGNAISEGNIHANGNIVFESGQPGSHTGNITAGDDIKIEKNNTIVGNVSAGDKLYLRGNASVTGTANAQVESTPVLLPTPVFTAGGKEVTVPKKGSLSLEPGSYGRVKVKKQGSLFLSSGDYFFQELDLDRGAVLTIEVSSGPVNINVVYNLEFDDYAAVNITPNGQVATNQVTFTTLQSHKIDVGVQSVILGWMIAPDAEVHFSAGCRFKGAIAADAITIEEGVPFLTHSSSLVLPKAKPMPAENDQEEQIRSVVSQYELAQNYPNPFNPATTIRFSLLEAGEVWLSIFNLQGQEVRTLVARQMTPGEYAVEWNGRDNSGQIVPSGIYLYKLRINGFEQTRRMSFVK